MGKLYRLQPEADFSSALWELYYQLHADLQRLSLGEKNSPADLQMLFSARKATKRMRALLRCMRGVLSTGQFTQLQNFYRKLSACIAPLRDAYVLERLLKSLPGNLLDEKHKKSLQAKLVAAYDDKAQQQARQLLVQLWQQWSELQPRSKNTEDHKVFWLELWQKALCDWQKAVKKRQVHYWHEARRSAKYLYFSLDFLGARLPRALQQLQRQIGDFAELLGNMHDIDVKIDWLKQHYSAAQLKSLNANLQAQRQAYVVQAERLGHCIFNAPLPQWLQQAFA